MEVLREFIPLLLPLVLLQLVLMVVALRDLMARGSSNGPKWMWVLIIVLGNTVGPILYFVIGRKDA